MQSSSVGLRRAEKLECGQVSILTGEQVLTERRVVRELAQREGRWGQIKKLLDNPHKRSFLAFFPSGQEATVALYGIIEGDGNGSIAPEIVYASGKEHAGAFGEALGRMVAGIGLGIAIKRGAHETIDAMIDAAEGGGARIVDPGEREDDGRIIVDSSRLTEADVPVITFFNQHWNVPSPILWRAIDPEHHRIPVGRPISMKPYAIAAMLGRPDVIMASQGDLIPVTGRPTEIIIALYEDREKRIVVERKTAALHALEYGVTGFSLGYIIKAIDGLEPEDPKVDALLAALLVQIHCEGIIAIELVQKAPGDAGLAIFLRTGPLVDRRFHIESGVRRVSYEIDQLQRNAGLAPKLYAAVVDNRRVGPLIGHGELPAEDIDVIKLGEGGPAAAPISS